MKTSDLEKLLGLSKHTIRYYEKEGFIQPHRDENGYRDYCDEDVQILKLVKFLRSLEISIDDVKAILSGDLNFQECLKMNQEYLNQQLESIKEVKQTVDYYQEKNVPLIPALNEFQIQSTKSMLGFQKTTSNVSLGRKLTRSWALRQIVYALIASLALGWILATFFFEDLFAKIICIMIIAMIFEVLFIASAFRQTTSLMLDNSMNQSVEFLNDGICYYQFTGFIHNLKYFIAVLLNKDEKYMSYYRYEDILSVEIRTMKRYMKIGSPLAYEVFVPDFHFYFKDGKDFYFFWPMILGDDIRMIAYILEDKIKNIDDKKNILYAMKNGINLNDYLIGE
ncbi:MAG: MerR family transcriptional regulator [Coprobacillus cateniformis]|uniref:MerR family transcriptional regulator n=1 Tax=Longibaculum muris TaxID=1796628 RepID=UPI003AB41010|nr:MerR family transcriptional regulator [Coprobacillus cateniformis]